MKTDDVLRARPLVQSVYILCDQRKSRIAFAPGGEHFVCAIRFFRRKDLPSPVIPFPYEFRVALECFGRSQRFGTKSFPKTVRSTKGRDAARRRHSRPSEYSDSSGRAECRGNSEDVVRRETVHLRYCPETPLLT